MTTITPAEDSRFDAMVERLSRLSVTKKSEAYVDIDWDAPEMALHHDDPRLRLPSHDPLTTTAWYQRLTDTEKSTLALYRVASSMKTGWQFENLLQRGLLKTAWHTANGAPTFRYAHHEIIEESEHSLMFQEFVNRSGLPVVGMPRFWQLLTPVLVGTAASFDRSLFLMLVLGGEEPVDHVQRLTLREGGLHPLTEQIMRIHVLEEARHISFAKNWLKEELPTLGRLHRFMLSLRFPIAMGVMVPMMIKPSKDLMAYCGLPREVARDAYRSPEGRQILLESSAKLRRLARDLGLINPVSKRVWKLVGLWSDDD